MREGRKSLPFILPRHELLYFFQITGIIPPSDCDDDVLPVSHWEVRFLRWQRLELHYFTLPTYSPEVTQLIAIVNLSSCEVERILEVTEYTSKGNHKVNLAVPESLLAKIKDRDIVLELLEQASCLSSLRFFFASRNLVCLKSPSLLLQFLILLSWV